MPWGGRGEGPGQDDRVAHGGASWHFFCVSLRRIRDEGTGRNRTASRRPSGGVTSPFRGDSGRTKSVRPWSCGVYFSQRGDNLLASRPAGRGASAGRGTSVACAVGPSPAPGWGG